MDPDIESVEGFTMHSVHKDDEDDDMAKTPRWTANSLDFWVHYETQPNFGHLNHT